MCCALLPNPVVLGDPSPGLGVAGQDPFLSSACHPQPGPTAAGDKGSTASLPHSRLLRIRGPLPPFQPGPSPRDCQGRGVPGRKTRLAVPQAPVTQFSPPQQPWSRVTADSASEPPDPGPESLSTSRLRLFQDRPGVATLGDWIRGGYQQELPLQEHSLSGRPRPGAPHAFKHFNPFYEWEDRGPERLRHLPRVTQRQSPELTLLESSIALRF